MAQLRGRVRVLEPRRSGFTLLELLVSLAVFGLLMVGLEQAVHFGLSAWGSQDRQLTRIGDLETVDRALRRLFMHVPLGTPDPGVAIFEGNAGEAKFFSQLPEGVAVERLAQMALLVENHQLILRWRPAPHLISFGRHPAPHTTLVLDHVADVSLAYRGGDAQDQWKPSWAEREPPKLIRITIVFPDGDPRRWPALIMALTPGLGNS